VPCLRRFVASITAQQPRFETRTVHLRFVVGKFVMGQGFLECCVVCIIPPLLHIYLHLHATITRRTKRRSLGTYKYGCPFSNQGEMHSKVFRRWKCVRLRLAFLSVILHWNYWNENLLLEDGERPNSHVVVCIQYTVPETGCQSEIWYCCNQPSSYRI